MSCSISSELIEKTIAFHGHSCPGLSIGIRAAELAIRELGHPDDIEMVAVSETDMCGVDAIQFLTGCTYGKGNFMHRDFGKMAFSFYDRKTGAGLRALLRTEAYDYMDGERGALVTKITNGTATKAERERADQIWENHKKQLMQLALDDVFTIQRLTDGPPRSAAILESLVCDMCGETVMESRTRRFGGKTTCIPCFAKVEQKI
ncbi:MAG: TraR/DksA C4-type zinc finger protein [Pseudodesulfovibrio sp.]|jgi:formylmethanofuran dehydrogenase subunit E|nr:TraR/DksA C4-type zinc finger protein [Pseudodesulfovibrio sp.]